MKKAAMELTPGESAVLTQIRKLCVDNRRRAHPVRSVTAVWPQAHYDAYSSAFGRLFAKSLIQVSANKRAFRVTEAGLILLGLAKQKPGSFAQSGLARAERQVAPAKRLTGWLRKKLITRFARAI
jgi:hypothetical protein